MDLLTKVTIGLGGLGAAVVTGAVIQASIDEREERRKEMRNRIMDLESKNRDMSYEIEILKGTNIRQDEQINEVRSRVLKIETIKNIEKT